MLLTSIPLPHTAPHRSIAKLNPRSTTQISLYGYGFASPWFFTPQPADTKIFDLECKEALDRAAVLEPIFSRKGAQVAGVPLEDPLCPRELLFYYMIATGRCESGRACSSCLAESGGLILVGFGSAPADFNEVFHQPQISSDPSVAHLWPQTSITASYPPTFLLHGTADSAIPYSESVKIGRASCRERV